MTTIDRNLTQIDGANVPAPTQNGFSASRLETFPDDASYEAVLVGLAAKATFTLTRPFNRFAITKTQPGKTS